ncbi:MAG: hotdog fold thioesterase [Actinomycetota bacterium]|nr:hotdog fold thioesterase [Actinomycetota bacterium]
MDERTAKITASFEKDPYARAQGFVLGEITESTLTVSMTVREDQVNFLGGTHGGVVFSIADCAFSLASNAYPQDAVAIDTHLAITAGTGTGDTLTATATEVARGRSLATYRVEVVRDDGRTVGAFTGTVFIQSAEDR